VDQWKDEILLRLDPDDLCDLLCQFLINARTEAGELYEPESLTRYLSCIRTWLGLFLFFFFNSFFELETLFCS
jgi:hypothetical protein